LQKRNNISRIPCSRTPLPNISYGPVMSFHECPAFTPRFFPYIQPQITHDRQPFCPLRHRPYGQVPVEFMHVHKQNIPRTDIDPHSILRQASLAPLIFPVFDHCQIPESLGVVPLVRMHGRLKIHIRRSLLLMLYNHILLHHPHLIKRKKKDLYMDLQQQLQLTTS
jgi:hypothetical protein